MLNGLLTCDDRIKSAPSPEKSLRSSTPAPDRAGALQQQAAAATPQLPSQQITAVWRAAQPDRYLGLSGRICAADAAMIEAPSPARLSAVHNPANHGTPDGNPEGPSLAARQVYDLGLLCA